MRFYVRLLFVRLSTSIRLYFLQFSLDLPELKILIKPPVSFLWCLCEKGFICWASFLKIPFSFTILLVTILDIGVSLEKGIINLGLFFILVNLISQFSIFLVCLTVYYRIFGAEDWAFPNKLKAFLSSVEHGCVLFHWT